MSANDKPEVGRPLYIFDLDGTLALTEHRQHLLEDKDDPDRWQKFFAACVHDKPNWPVILTLGNLLPFAEIRIWSGRSDEVRRETVTWLGWHLASIHPEAPDALAAAEKVAELYQLKMRPAGDFTPDDELKRSWYEALSDDECSRLVAVFDDRAKVVAMWRAQGVACFQVAPGEF